MPGSNLTRAEARERAELLAVDSYEVWLDLTDGSGQPGERTYRTRPHRSTVHRQHAGRRDLLRPDR
ncbi:hypothetical protein [Fodinicola feengrottensis]|uniref:hypothetical protein n=1 Tax=Fodinicola feengrottensis TaxID=435914 RepID=UPI002442C279|nr:hypothetical protein [Fodinicola feengrottensis]